MQDITIFVATITSPTAKKPSKIVVNSVDHQYAVFLPIDPTRNLFLDTVIDQLKKDNYKIIGVDHDDYNYYIAATGGQYEANH